MTWSCTHPNLTYYGEWGGQIIRHCLQCGMLELEERYTGQRHEMVPAIVRYVRMLEEERDGDETD